MLWTVLARLDGADTAPGGVWYARAAAWSVENGVSDGADPDGAITREQLVTMLWRLSGSPAADASLDGYADAAGVSAYASQAVRWAVAQGVLTGGSDGSLSPQSPATRAQVAAILMRFMTRE